MSVENRGPVSVTLRARSSAALEHSTAITLYRDSERIDIRNEIVANFSDVRHWGFSFNLAAPAVHTEEVGAINLNRLAAHGGAYADTHARYDYITLNHFADVTAGDGSRGVTLSNADLAFARLGRSTLTTLDTETPQLHALAGGQVDGRSLGIRDQNGESAFLQRFALRPHDGYDPAAAMRFALEHQNPLIAAPVIGRETGAYDAMHFSLLSVSDPSVLLWAVKPAEEGIEHGVVACWWNLADAPTSTSLTFARALSAAHRTTHIETNLASVSLTGADRVPMTFVRQQLQTYRLIPTAGAR